MGIMKKGRVTRVSRTAGILAVAFASLGVVGPAAAANVNRNVNVQSAHTSVNVNRNVNANGNGANVNRNVNVNGNNGNINRNVNVNSNVNVNRNVSVNSGYDRWGHPVAAAATAVAVGTAVASLPASGCSGVAVGGVSYQRCGPSYYQPVYQGGGVTYVVVNPPQ
jgi:hypothetical protein